MDRKYSDHKGPPHPLSLGVPLVGKIDTFVSSWLFEYRDTHAASITFSSFSLSKGVILILSCVEEKTRDVWTCIIFLIRFGTLILWRKNYRYIRFFFILGTTKLELIRYKHELCNSLLSLTCFFVLFVFIDLERPMTPVYTSLEY